MEVEALWWGLQVFLCVGLARTVYIHTVYDRIFGDFPATNSVCTPYIYGSGQPYLCAKGLSSSQGLRCKSKKRGRENVSKKRCSLVGVGVGVGAGGAAGDTI
jgi:hypothetical protein